MGSECTSLPVIDLTNLKHGTPGWQTAKAQVIESVQEFGAFEAKFDEIPHPLGEALVDGIKQMFDLPLEAKLRYKANTPHLGGYLNPEDALNETLSIIEVDQPGKVEACTTLLWPEGNPPFNDIVLSWMEKLIKMERMIRTLVLEGLGLEKYMDDHLESTLYSMRFQKYDAPHTQEAQVGLVAHTDKNYVTILYQNKVRGLDVQTKRGCWFTTEPSPNSYIVFVGDSYHAWTNGRLHSALHRVTLNGDADRYSIALFSAPIAGYIVKAPEELVDEDHPLLFKPFDLHEFLQAVDLASPGALKKYCGV